MTFRAVCGLFKDGRHHCGTSLPCQPHASRLADTWLAGGSALTGGLEQASAGAVDAPFAAAGVRLVAQKLERLFWRLSLAVSDRIPSARCGHKETGQVPSCITHGRREQPTTQAANGTFRFANPLNLECW